MMGEGGRRAAFSAPLAHPDIPRSSRKAAKREILLCDFEGCGKIFSNRQYLNVRPVVVGREGPKSLFFCAREVQPSAFIPPAPCFEPLLWSLLSQILSPELRF